jgi:hypothetical protein
MVFIKQIILIAIAIAVRTHLMVETLHATSGTTVRKVLIDVSTAIIRIKYPCFARDKAEVR